MHPLTTSPAHGRTWSDLDDFQAFIDDGGMVEPGDEMPDEYRQEVFRFIEFHAHLLYMVGADMGVKTRTAMLEDLFAGRSRFHNVFHYQAVTWADQVAIAYLVDAAAFASQRAVFAECTYGPYKRVLKRIVAEEGFHMRHGEEMLLRLATGTDVQRAMFQASLDRWWWPAVQLFGPDSDPSDPLLAWKIKSQPNEVLRDAYVQKYVPLLQSYGFRIPDDGLHQADNGQWRTSPIDWAPLKATMRNGGPDSRRRIETARRNWSDTAWARDALERATDGAAQ